VTELFKITVIYMMKKFLLIFLPTHGVLLDAITTSSLITSFLITYASIFSLHILLIIITVCLICTVVDASTINAFQAQLDKFSMHQAVKYDFTADLTGSGNRSEAVTKRYFFIY